MDEPRKWFAAMMSGLDIRYDLGEGHPLLGRRMPDLDIVTSKGPMRVFELLHDARPVLINFGESGSIDIAPWADRVQLTDAKYAGAWEYLQAGWAQAGGVCTAAGQPAATPSSRRRLASEFAVYLRTSASHGLPGPRMRQQLRTPGGPAGRADHGAREVATCSRTLIALQAARTAPAIGQVAVYEDLYLLMNTSSQCATGSRWTRRWPAAAADADRPRPRLDLGPAALPVPAQPLLVADAGA